MFEDEDQTKENLVKQTPKARGKYFSYFTFEQI
jgi:hypothetical protein